MGVFGLTTYFNEHSTARKRVRLTELSRKIQQTGKKATLLCDFLSIKPNVLECLDHHLIDKQELSPFSLLYGGNYHMYAERFIGLVKALRHLGIELIFFVDGPVGVDAAELDAKLSTLKRRYYERLQRTLEIQQICEGTRPVRKTWYKDLVTTTQIIMSLRSAGIQVVICLGEADPDIAEYARSHEEVIGILAADSDFAVMANSTLFPWKFFDCEETLGTRSSLIDVTPDDIVCQVVSPASLAEALEIREDQIPDLAVLCGNDYTRHLNRKLSVFSELGIENPELDIVEVIAKWLRGKELPLLESELVRSFCLKHPEYRDAVEHSYHMYSADYSRNDEPNSKPACSFFPMVKQEVQAGHMMRFFLSIAKNGIVWLKDPFESLTLGQPCVLDMLLPLRKAMYALLGLKSVKEFGRTYNKAFQEAHIEVNPKLAQTGPKSLRSLRRMSRNTELLSFFEIMVNCRSMGLRRLRQLPNQVAQVDLPDNMSSHGTFICACLQLMAVLNNTSQPSPNLSQAELDALLVTCLTCSAGISPHHTSALPTMRAITVKEWFLHIILNAYNVATLVGLRMEDLPEPRNVFYGMAFIPYYTVATQKCHSHNELTAVHKAMENVLSSETVRAFKSAILAEDEPCDLPTLLALFAAAHEVLETNKHCFKNFPAYLPLVELQKDAAKDNGVNRGFPDKSYLECGGHNEKGLLASTLSSASSESSKEAVLQHLMPSSGGNAPLPVMAHHQKTLQLIDTHRVVCIEGETGCGKSSQVPQFILDAARIHHKECKILVSQPTAIAAIKLAQRVAAERREEIGLTVGYCTEDRRVESPTCQLIYMTTGILLKTLTENKCGQLCTHVIIDEVHERSVDIDFVMLVARKLAQKYPKLKIILMSATMQSELFVKYFQQAFGRDQVASPYFVGKKRFPIDVYYLDNLTTLVELAREKKGHFPIEQMEATVCLSKMINNRPGQMTNRPKNPTISTFLKKICTEVIISQARLGEGIMVFLPGLRAIVDYHQQLIAQLKRRRIKDRFSVFVLHSEVPCEEQKQAFHPPPFDKAHVILTSRVSESSITIPKLKVVINFGITQKLEYDSSKRISSLLNWWSSHCSYTHRQGRVGRDSPGIAVHLITKQFYDAVLPQFDLPEIRTASLAKVVLKAKQIGKQFTIPRPTDFLSLTIEPPSLLHMDAATQDLVDFGAMSYNPDQEDAEMTSFGLFSLLLPLDLALCRLVYFGIFFGCPIDAIVMAAALSMQIDMFSLPTRLVMRDLYDYCRSLRGSMDSRFEFDGHLYSDPIMMRNLFIKWLEFRSQPHYRLEERHEIALRFSYIHVSSVRSDRLLEFESLVCEYVNSILHHFPPSSVTWNKLQLLVSVVERVEEFKLRLAAPGDSSQRPNSEISFCRDANILKALFIAAYPNQIICGERQFKSSECKEALKVITDTQFDLSHTLVMSLEMDEADACADTSGSDEESSNEDAASNRSIKGNTMSETGMVSNEYLRQLMKTLLPNHCCRTKVANNLALIELGTLQRSLSSPGTRGTRESKFQDKLGTQMIAQGGSVGVSTPPEEVVFLWQFGERRNTWEIEGINAKFTSPFHPCALAWHTLSQNRETVDIYNWRNPTAFVCKQGSSKEPIFAIASTLMGTRSEYYLLAKHLTILPQTPATIMLLLAFQPLFTKVELLIDKAQQEVVAVSINSRRINVCSNLTAEDIRQINSLRKVLSRAVYSSMTAELPPALPIPQLLQKILSQRPTTVVRSCASGAVKPALDESFVWERVVPGPKDGQLHTFQYYPSFHCSVLGDTPYASREEVNPSSAELHHSSEISLPVTASQLSHNKPQRRVVDAENDLLNCSGDAQVSDVPREVASAVQNLTITKDLGDSKSSLVEYFKAYLVRNDGEARLVDIQSAFERCNEEHAVSSKLKQLDSYIEFFKSHSEEFVICEGARAHMTTVRLKKLVLQTSHSPMRGDTKDLQLQLDSKCDIHQPSGDTLRMTTLQDTPSSKQDSSDCPTTVVPMAASIGDSILDTPVSKLTVLERFDSCLPAVNHEDVVQCGGLSGLSDSEATPGSVAHTVEYFKQYLSTRQEGCSIHHLVVVHEVKYKQEHAWPVAPELPHINEGFFRNHPEVFKVTKRNIIKLKTKSKSTCTAAQTSSPQQSEEHCRNKLRSGDTKHMETAECIVQSTATVSQVTMKPQEKFPPPTKESSATEHDQGSLDEVTLVVDPTAGQIRSSAPGHRNRRKRRKK